MTALDDIAAKQSVAKEGVDQETVDAVRSVGARYKYGFSSDIETEYAPKGLNEDIVRLISAKKEEPEWMLDWRLGAYKRWLQMDEPTNLMSVTAALTLARCPSPEALTEAVERLVARQPGLRRRAARSRRAGR